MSRVIPEQHFNTLVSLGEQPQQQVAANPSIDTQRISYYQWVPLILIVQAVRTRRDC